MREIKFRAKTIDGTWFYWKLTDPIDMAEMKDVIDWSTFGQYTGLKDKNGKEIYHFDILSLPMRFSGDHTYKPSIAVMQWEHDGWYVEDQGECGYSEMEVIGNIYENPELIK
jgi:uncharacterized phage protein (TIGR01671 family)